MSSGSGPRLAVIGCGAVVAQHLAPSLRRIGWQPSVLVDPAPQRTEIVARRLGQGRRSLVKAADWREAASAFDAALIAAPHALHGPLGLALLEAGKHVFTEKPLAISRSDGQRMVELAESRGRVLAVGLLRRQLRIARWTKALLEAGVLGEIRHFEVREGFVFNWATSTHALLDPTLAGGGVLMDTGAHTLDLVLWWLGDVESVACRDDALGGVEADCLIECRMHAGATGRIELSRSRELANTIRIDGTLGFVEVHLYKNEVIAGSPEALAFVHEGIGAAAMEPQFFPELFDAELREFRAAIVSGALLKAPGREGLRSVGLIERCYRVRKALRLPWEDDGAQVPAGARPSLPAGARVLVTGATGFIGGRLAETLHVGGCHVRCLVRGFGQAVRLARFRPEIVAADLADPAAIERAVAGMDYVIHCAYDHRSREQNMSGLANLIAASVRHKVRRLVLVSSFAVYEPFPDGPLDETTRDGDRGWPYVRNKLDMEAMLMAAVREQGLAGSIVQPAIVFGPFGGAWTKWPAENLIYDTVVLPEDDGLCNALYVDDLVDGLILAAMERAAVGERFILSGPAPVTWGAFFGSIAAALGVRPPERWPAARISTSNQGLVRDLKLVAGNPKKIIQIMVRWPPARQALQAGLNAMPEPLKGLVMKHYFGSGARKPGGIVLPDPQQLRLYQSKAVCDNAKARRLIGYAPRYDLAAGSGPTRLYLEWAYGDVKRAVRAKETSREAAAASGQWTETNAG